MFGLNDDLLYHSTEVFAEKENQYIFRTIGHLSEEIKLKKDTQSTCLTCLEENGT